MEKFPKIKYPNDPETDGVMTSDVVVTEKLDGANFRFTWDGHGDLLVGTRNHTYHHDDENLPKAFEHAVEYIQNTVPDDVPQEKSNYTLYGEAMHKHSLDYEGIDWHIPNKGSPHIPLDSEYPNVVVFDAQRLDDWLSWDSVRALAGDLGLTTTPVLERGQPDALSFDIPEESMFGGPPEGIVVRRLDGSVRAKKVAEHFKEKKGQASGGTSEAASDAAEFVRTYLTDARIEKQAHKLVDEGEYEHLQMAMMEDLPRRALTDAMAENGWDLLTNDFETEWDDEFKGEVRSKASSKCASVLKSLCQEF